MKNKEAAKELTTCIKRIVNNALEKLELIDINSTAIDSLLHIESHADQLFKLLEKEKT